MTPKIDRTIMAPKIDRLITKIDRAIMKTNNSSAINNWPHSYGNQ